MPLYFSKSPFSVILIAGFTLVPGFMLCDSPRGGGYPHAGHLSVCHVWVMIPVPRSLPCPAWPQPLFPVPADVP